MGDDPVLQIGLSVMIVLMPFLSIILSKKKLKHIFIIPLASMIIAFPIFLFLVILQNSTVYSRYLFYISMILWTSGGFTMIFSSIIYFRNKNKEE